MVGLDGHDLPMMVDDASGDSVSMLATVPATSCSLLPHNGLATTQPQLQQQLGRAVATPAAVVGTGADGAATSSVTSSAASSSGVAPAMTTFIEVELVFSDDVIVGRGV